MYCPHRLWEPSEIAKTVGGSFDQEPWRGDVVGQLEAAGRKVAWMTESVGNELATDEQAKFLGMTVDESLLVVTRHAFHENQLIEVPDVSYPGFHTRIQFRSISTAQTSQVVTQDARGDHAASPRVDQPRRACDRVSPALPGSRGHSPGRLAFLRPRVSAELGESRSIDDQWLLGGGPAVITARGRDAGSVRVRRTAGTARVAGGGRARSAMRCG